jgi:hypothetical protein
MERRKFIARVGIGTLATCATVPVIASNLENSGENPSLPLLEKEEVQHMVIFDLKHQKGSAEAEKFLADGRKILSNIPVVQNFQAFNQVSLKNDYTYGFSMVFKDQQAYSTYNNHPDHVAFVENRWKKEVTRFLEIDFNAH